jgi:hypothetical protein
MKVICINNRNSSRLFLDKIYEAVRVDEFEPKSGLYYIIDGWWEFRHNFITLEEYRNNKLVELCQ